MNISFVAVFGYLGACLSSYAYVPQIYHLIKERCTAGLSRKAYGIWLVSSLIMLVNALYIDSPVFMFLTVFQSVATGIIFGFTIRYNGSVCPYHLHNPSGQEYFSHNTK